MKHFQLVIPPWKIFTREWKWNLRDTWKSTISAEFTACNKRNLKKYCWWGVAENLSFSLCLPCCWNMQIKGSVLGWSPFALSLWRRCCCTHQGLTCVWNVFAGRARSCRLWVKRKKSITLRLPPRRATNPGTLWSSCPRGSPAGHSEYGSDCSWALWGHSLESCDHDLSVGDKDGALLFEEWDSDVDAWVHTTRLALQCEGAMK